MADSSRNPLDKFAAAEARANSWDDLANDAQSAEVQSISRQLIRERKIRVIPRGDGGIRIVEVVQSNPHPRKG